MANAAQASQNFQALKKKSFDIQFNLENSDYEPIENIGTGAYGVVCSAVNCKTQKKVAIKKIPRIFEQPIIAKRTYREIKILKHFKHDNIIAIQEILKPDKNHFDDVYIVLDLMESDLHRIIHSDQALSEEHARYFLYQILRGLKYIHSANVVHRDLKPSNLLVNENCDLKIGDFGMARGISSTAHEENFMMTQYVATRWYRAPELMLLPMAYTAAVDMWSVGCIVAEMLGRRQIFPGRDHRDQLRLIIGILGSPSADFLRLTHSDIVRNYIEGLGVKKAESLERLYPKASSPVLKLLKSMLLIDPRHRITVDKALESTFLAKYHDIDDEPICIPVFDFGFEKESLDGPKLRKVITEEILTFHKKPPKPQASIFNFKPVPKSKTNKASTSTSSPGRTPEHSSNLLQQAAKDRKALSDSQLPFYKLLQEKDKMSPKVISVPKKDAVQAGKNSSDVEMLSAKDSQSEHKGLATSVNTLQKPVGDIHMSSAKDNKTEEVVPVFSTAPAPDMQTLPLDTKARIKAALLSSKRRLKSETTNERPRITALQRQREREEKRRKKKERAQEKKKKEGPKAGKQAAPKLLSLTTEDKNLLERWKNMAGNPASTALMANLGDTGSNSMSVADPGVTVPLIQPQDFAAVAQPVSQVPTTQVNPMSVTSTAAAQSVNPMTMTMAPMPLVNTMSMQGLDVTDVNLQKELAVGGSFETKPFPDMGFEMKPEVITVSQPTQPAQKELTVGRSFETKPFSEMGFEVKPDVITVSQPTQPGAFMGFRNGHTMLHQEDHKLSDIKSLVNAPSTTLPFAGYSQSTTLGLSEQKSLIMSSFSQQQAPVPAFTDIVAPSFPGQGFTVFPPQSSSMHPELPKGETQPTDCSHISQTSVSQAGDNTTIPFNPRVPTILAPESNPAGSEDPVLGVVSHPLNPLAPTTEAPGLDPLQIITKQMMRSHVEDLTLTQTPKGTGGGYGVGLDLDCMLQPGGRDARQDSAPLSASLISDWLDVTGSMDIQDIEALQRELELTSPITSLADLSALADPYDKPTEHGFQ